MRTFILHLQSERHYEHYDAVVSFIGEDSTGSFGILAGHARMMTILITGLVRFRTDDERWYYVALPGGVLYFLDNALYINTRHYLLDTDYQRIGSALHEQFRTEEQVLRNIKSSLRRLEGEMFKRLSTLSPHQDTHL